MGYGIKISFPRPPQWRHRSPGFLKFLSFVEWQNKQTNNQKQNNGFMGFSGFQTHLTIRTCLLFFHNCICFFAPLFPFEILDCFTDSYSLRAKNALNSWMSCNFAILKKYGRRIAPDLIGITREVHKGWERVYTTFLASYSGPFWRNDVQSKRRNSKKTWPDLEKTRRNQL